MDHDPLAQTIVFTRDGSRRSRGFADDDVRAPSPVAGLGIDRAGQLTPDSSERDLSDAAARAADLRSSSTENINKRATVVYDRDAFRKMEQELREMRLREEAAAAAKDNNKDKDVNRRATVVYTDRETMRKLTEDERWQQETLEMVQLREQNARLKQELIEAQTSIRSLTAENRGLRRSVAELNGRSTQYEADMGSLRVQVDQLTAKLSQQEFLRGLAQSSSPAAVLQKEFSRPLSSQELHVARPPVDRSVAQSLQWIENPLEAAVRVFQALLKDANYRDIHHFLASIIDSLSAAMRTQGPELEQLLTSSGVDELTSTWIVYEYSRLGRSIPAGLPANTLAQAEVPLELVPVAEKAVVNDWGFCAFDYTTEEQISLYVHMMEELGVMEPLGVPRNNLIRLLRALCKLYHSKNPYHNFTHAFDVAQACFKLVHQTTARDYLTDLDVFCLMVAAIAHDTDHPGVNNAFQINDSTALAMVYNDQSPLENHHSARFFITCSAPENNIFAGMGTPAYMAARRMIIQAILRTDMTHHFDLMKSVETQGSLNVFAGKSPESRQLLVNMLLHTADISNPTRPWALCKSWSDRVLEEFFQQGDLEKDKGLPVSPQCDRATTDQAKMSLGFIDFIVAPAVTVLARLLPAAVAPLLESLTANRARWEEINKAQSGPGSRPATPEPDAASPLQSHQQQQSPGQQQQPARLGSPLAEASRILASRTGVAPLKPTAAGAVLPAGAVMPASPSAAGSPATPSPLPAAAAAASSSNSSSTSSPKHFNLRLSAEQLDPRLRTDLRELPTNRWASPTKMTEEHGSSDLSPERRRRSVSTPTGAAMSVIAGIEPSGGPTGPRTRSLGMNVIGQKRAVPFQPNKGGAVAALSIQMPGQILEKDPSLDLSSRGKITALPPPPPLLRQGSGASFSEKSLPNIQKPT